MAAYREHISVSGLLGIVYGACAAFVFGFTPVQGALAGVMAWVAGMLPDLDSQSGKPVREIFNLIAAAAPLCLMSRLLRWGGNAEGAMLLSILIYVSIRYGGAIVLGKLSVHRGMFHSIPAMLIAAELAFLAYESSTLGVKLLMAGGVATGFLSHLVLDEIYAVQWTGLRFRLNKFAGSAMKMFGPRLVPNVFTYSLLAVLTYASLVDVGVLASPGEQWLQSPSPRAEHNEPPSQQAAGNGPARR